MNINNIITIMIYNQPQTKVQEYDFDDSICASTAQTGSNTNQDFSFDGEEDIL